MPTLADTEQSARKRWGAEIKWTLFKFKPLLKQLLLIKPLDITTYRRKHWNSGIFVLYAFVCNKFPSAYFVIPNVCPFLWDVPIETYGTSAYKNLAWTKCTGAVCPGPWRMKKRGLAWALRWIRCICGGLHFPCRNPRCFYRRWSQELHILPQQSIPSPLTDLIQLHS